MRYTLRALRYIRTLTALCFFTASVLLCTLILSTSTVSYTAAQERDVILITDDLPPLEKTPERAEEKPEERTGEKSEEKSVQKEALQVPFYSQFKDISDPEWQKVGCGITSLGMIIEFYKPNTISVDTLLAQGIAAGAYLSNAGWTYKGLIEVSKKYDMDGSSHDLGGQGATSAFTEFKKHLQDGPVIASVHYNFDPQSTIPHLVVINRIVDDVLYYNDPAAKNGENRISVNKFLKAWKKRFIVVRPAGAHLAS